MSIREKPSEWGLDKGLTSPDWNWFWRSARLAAPFWEGGGYVYGSGQRGMLTAIPTNISSGGWRISACGPVFELDGSAANTEYLSLSKGWGPFPTNQPRTTCITFIPFQGITSIQTLISCGTNAIKELNFFHINAVSVGDLYYGHNNRDFYTGGSAIVANEVNTVFFIYSGQNISPLSPGINIWIYVQNSIYPFPTSLPLATAGTGAGTVDTGDANYQIGNDFLGNRAFDGQILSASVHFDPFTEGQMNQLARDPFGPYRLDEYFFTDYSVPPPPPATKNYYSGGSIAAQRLTRGIGWVQ